VGDFDHPAPRFVAKVRGVREIGLGMHADPVFWRDHLDRFALAPLVVDGRALVTITCAELRWWGTRTREVTVAVALSEPEGAYLAGAFHSSTVFAAVERVFFQTPYSAARIRMPPRPALAFMVADGSGLAIAADAGAQDPKAPRTPPARESVDWLGRVFLPPLGAGQRPYFVARLAGDVERRAFSPSADRFRVTLPEAAPRTAAGSAVQALVDSSVAPYEWWTRSAGYHARTRTVALGDE
jgi:hypothetical protein